MKVLTDPHNSTINIKMANLEGMSLISTQKEKTAAEVKNISALADAEARKTAADAENQRLIDAATAEGEALRIKAKAEAESIKLKAVAEAERAEMVAKTDLGKQGENSNMLSVASRA